jgi:hypothetical protein
VDSDKKIKGLRLRIRMRMRIEIKKLSKRRRIR